MLLVYLCAERSLRNLWIVSANWWGKLKMLCQVAGVTLFLLQLRTGIASFATASYAVFALAIALAIGSLVKHGV